MAIIPVYNEKIGVDAPGVQTPQMADITPAASGAGIAEASSKLGQTVENIGSQLGRHLAYMAHLKQQQQGYDIAATYARNGQVFLNGDGKDNPGILNLHGKDADNSIAAFQDWDKQQRKELLKDLPPASARNVDRMIDSHGTVFFDNALHHQRHETEVAQQNSRAAEVQATQDTASLPNTTPGQFSDLVTKAQDITRQMHPGQDDATYEALDQKTAAGMMQNYVKSNLEDHPQETLKMLAAQKGSMHEADYGAIKKQIDGKMLDIRRGVIWEQVSGFTHSDGTVDLQRAEAHAKQLASTLPPNEQQHVVDFVRQQASVQDSALKDARQAQDRSFINDSMGLKAKGLSYDQAHDALFKDKGYGFDPKDIQEKSDQLRKLYTHDDSFLDYAQQHQTAEQKDAWTWTEKVATAGIPKHDVQAFIVQEKKKWMGKSADQIRAGVTEDLKKLEVPGGHWWTSKVQGWKMDADITQANAEKIGALEAKYPGQVSIAKAALEAKGKMTDPDAIAKYLAIAHQK